MSSAIKASVIRVAAVLLSLALRGASASARRLVWIAVAACMLVLPVLSLVTPSLGLRQPSLAFEPAALTDGLVAPVSAAVVASVAKRQPLPWILILWAGGLLMVLGRLGAGMARMGWLRRAAQRNGARQRAAALATRTRAGPGRVVW